MGAIPVLIMLAAVGLDYGWQPDPATSSGGDQVEYIIQIPPDQVEQIRSLGEITSAIDPSIQGRVSKIVIRIGTGPLPRDGGRSNASASAGKSPVAQAVAVSEDDLEVPIPEIHGDLLAQVTPKHSDKRDSESLMKPDPQGEGGFALPEGLGNTARTNPAVSTDPATQRENRWDAAGGRGDAAATNSATSTPVGAAAQGPSTEPVDPRGRPQPPAGTNRPESRSSSEAVTSPGANLAAPTPSPSSIGAAADSRAAASPSSRATDPSDPTWSGYGTTPTFGALPPGLSPSADILRPQAGADRAAAQSTADPQRALATTLAPPAESRPSPTAPSTTATPNPEGESGGIALDRLGRPVDSQGRLVDPQTGHLVDSSGNWIDQYGRRIDRLGRLLSRGPDPVGSHSGQSNLDSPSQHTGTSGYGQPSGYGQTPQPVAEPGLDRTQYGQPTQPAVPNQAAPGNVAGYPSGYQAPAQPPYAGYPRSSPYPPTPPPNNVGYPTTTAPPVSQPVAYTPPASTGDRRQSPSRDDSRPRIDDEDDAFASPSDRRRDGASRDRGRGRADDLATTPDAAAEERPKTVAAQPFFNFVLLISLVGNAYLIYETGNLRRKFRNMIANVRASKLSTQPAS